MSPFPRREIACFIDEVTRIHLESGFIIKPNVISINRINKSLGYIWCVIESWAGFGRFKPRQVFFFLGMPNSRSQRDRRNWTDADMMRITTAQLNGREINAVSGRELHAFLEVGKVFAAWMPEQIEAFGFIQGQDFEVIDGLSLPNLESAKSRQQKTKEYLISLSMAKELAMVQRNHASCILPLWRGAVLPQALMLKDGKVSRGAR